jgi:hypothetical protein
VDSHSVDADRTARSRTPERIVALVPACVAIVAVALAWCSDAAWFGTTERVMSVITIVGTLMSAAAIFHDDVRVRVWVTCVLLLGAPALRLGELCGHEFSYILWDHGLVASIVSVVVLAVIVGLVRGHEWGRWIGLGGTLSGLGGALLNGFGSLADPGVYAWAHACVGAGCGSLVLLLSGPSMRDAFEGPAASASLWRSREPVIRALRWTLISTLVAAPMLVVYANMQPIVPGSVGFAWALAGVQLGATGLCLARKVVGALVLALAGAALLLFTMVCVVAAWGLNALEPGSLQIMGYYAVFWVPSGVASVVAGATMLRPLRTLLRER